MIRRYGSRSELLSAVFFCLLFSAALIAPHGAEANTTDYLLNNIELKLMSIIEYSDRLASELINSRMALKQSEAFVNELRSELDQLSHELGNWKTLSDSQATRAEQLKNIVALLETRLSKLSERYENTVVELQKVAERYQAELAAVRRQRDLMIGAAVVAAIVACIGFIF